MNQNKFINEYKIFLKQNLDPKRAKWDKAYLYSNLTHHGIPSKKVSEFLKAYKSEFKELSKSDILELSSKLWNTDIYELKMTGVHLLSQHANKLDLSDIPLIEKTMRESKGWAFLDSFIIPIMPILLEKYPESWKILDKWILDNDYWVRRSALLSQLLLFRKGKGDKNLFFEMAKSQFDESWIENKYYTKEDLKRARFFIRKAIGWALREMAKKDPESVKKFLKDSKEKMSGLSYREASKHLDI